jgi:uncharacterized Zn-binding protein involved in type VI secretion
MVSLSNHGPHRLFSMPGGVSYFLASALSVRSANIRRMRRLTPMREGAMIRRGLFAALCGGALLMGAAQGAAEDAKQPAAAEAQKPAAADPAPAAAPTSPVTPTAPAAPDAAVSVITSGSNNVVVGGQDAARKGDATDAGQAVVEGSSNVFINGKPAVRVGDRTNCGGIVVGGASNVFVTGKPLARAGDLAAGCPVK